MRKITETKSPQAKAVTVAELRQFLAGIDGCPDDTEIKARVSFGGRLTEISAEVP